MSRKKCVIIAMEQHTMPSPLSIVIDQKTYLKHFDAIFSSLSLVSTTFLKPFYGTLCRNNTLSKVTTILCLDNSSISRGRKLPNNCSIQTIFCSTHNHSKC